MKKPYPTHSHTHTIKKQWERREREREGERARASASERDDEKCMSARKADSARHNGIIFLSLPCNGKLCISQSIRKIGASASFFFFLFPFNMIQHCSGDMSLSVAMRCRMCNRDSNRMSKELFHFYYCIYIRFDVHGHGHCGLGHAGYTTAQNQFTYLAYE